MFDEDVAEEELERAANEFDAVEGLNNEDTLVYKFI